VVRELPLAFHAMPEGLAGLVIAIAVVLQEPVAVLRQCHCVRARLALARSQPSAVPANAADRWIADRAVVVVITEITEITNGDHSKRADSRQRPRLGPAERVLAVADEFAFRTAREIQVPREGLARVKRTVPNVVLAIRPARSVTGIVSSVAGIRFAGTSRTLTK
jgi:hypothetical protein